MVRPPARLLGAVLAGSLAVALGACAPGSGGEDKAAAPTTVNWSGFRGKTLTYVYFTDGPDEQATRERIAAFEQETGAKVNLQLVPFSDLEKTLQARVSGSSVPEVARVQDWHPYADALVDFTRYFGKDYPNEFIPGEAKASDDGQGHMYAVPSDLTMNGPLINVDAFNRAGVPVPAAGSTWTWDQMVADARKVAEANHMESALAIDKSGHRVSTVLSQFGTTMIGQNGQEALDSGKAARALGALTDLMKSGVMSKDFWLESGTRYKGANDMFLAQAVPVYISGNWQVAQFAKNARFTWAAVPNPCQERCGGFPGGKYMVAFKNSANPDLAAAFVQWMNRTENQRALDRQSGWMPTRKDLTATGIDYPQRAADMKVFLDDVAKTPEDTYAAEASPAFTGSASFLVAEIAKVTAGQEDVNTAVSNVKQQVAKLVRETTR
ncbi:ABC transporter substrate-binding protein [Gandjariella thermophila]|uniref:Sugar ABC transporter substrate-binding protein n=1 Tax=Gandjariella thermophila TaxID=1931992 RepID=A0A4D4J5F0_9PSEU|nr:extracellular solute-binding protein [Gandjariella thermophila]GDY31761.1 sugar ABC transporter substrate-binding protein [Gandjariella thermophila]